MIVSLLRPFRDSYRLSMHRYADAILRRVPPLLSPRDEVRDVELPGARPDRPLPRYWDQYRRYQRFAATIPGDVFHVVDHGYGHLATSLPAGRAIVTFHDAVPLKVPGASWRTRLSLRYSLRGMRHAAAIVCVSEAGKRDLLELADIRAERVSVIPWGIDEAFGVPVDRAALRRRLGLERPTVLMTGHTQTYMNVERMLRAFSALVSGGVDAALVKIGLPFTSEHTRVIDQLGIRDRLSFVGRVSDADLPSYFQAADVLLYAPLLAGFGLPPLEAMACGTPVVASNRGSIPDVVGEGAICVDAEDEGAMAGALSSVLTDHAVRERLRLAGLERAAAFRWDDAAARLADLYRRVARG